MSIYGELAEKGLKGAQTAFFQVALLMLGVGAVLGGLGFWLVSR